MLAALLGGLIAQVFGQGNFSKPNFSSLADLKFEQRIVTSEEQATEEAIAAVSPSVVSISGSDGKKAISGSGFVISSDGKILTNAHVVSNPDADLQVDIPNIGKFKVAELKLSKKNDIALITIAADNLPAVKLGDSDKVKVGQKVIAIGNPFGSLGNTVTSGIVSALGRSIDINDQLTTYQQNTYQDLIQIDAALNPGNSGGPLIDLNGRVIGINFAIRQGAENIGFTIPINEAREILN